jgi:hypothetical protein
MTVEVEVGDKVAFSATWLRSIGAYTGPLPFARGEVTAIRDCGSVKIAAVAWDPNAHGFEATEDEMPSETVNVKNLVPVGSPAFQRGD